MHFKKVLRTKVLFPLSRLMLGGFSPEKLAFAMAVGFTLGCFPVLGPSTLICLLAAWIFRLNVPAIQLGNYISTPLQLALLIPAYEFGGLIFGTSKGVPDFSAIFMMIRTEPLKGLTEIGNSVWQAVIVWALYSPVLFIVVYFLLKLILIKWQSKEANHETFIVPDTVQ